MSSDVRFSNPRMGRLENLLRQRLCFRIRMERAVFVEEKIAQPHGQFFGAQRAAFSFRKLFQVQGLLAQNLAHRLPPDRVFGKRVLGVLAQPFEGKLQDVDAIPGRKISNVPCLFFV